MGILKFLISVTVAIVLFIIEMLFKVAFTNK